MTDARMTAESITNYLVQVECRYCGSEVYPSSFPHDDRGVRRVAAMWIEDGVETIEEVRDRVVRMCDGCRHFLERDD